MTSTYGKRGGTSATAGRKSETISVSIAGDTYRKRVFFGQRFIVVSQHEGQPPVVTAHHTQEQAERQSEEARRLGYEFHAWAEATAMRTEP